MVAHDICAEPFKSKVRKTGSSGICLFFGLHEFVWCRNWLTVNPQIPDKSLLQTSKISSFFVTHTCLLGFELTPLKTLSKHSALTLQTFLLMLVRPVTCSFRQLMSKRECQRAQTHNPLLTWQVYAGIPKFGQGLDIALQPIWHLKIRFLKGSKSQNSAHRARVLTLCTIRNDWRP